MVADVKLIEVEPGRWRVDKTRHRPARSSLPLPNVISDTMDATEQVDGKFYTSKRAFRAVGRAHGLTEVGNEKLPAITRSTMKKSTKEQRRRDINVALAKYKAGQRPKRRQE